MAVGSTGSTGSGKDSDEKKWRVTVTAILVELRKILDYATSAYAILMLSSGRAAVLPGWIDRGCRCIQHYIRLVTQ